MIMQFVQRILTSYYTHYSITCTFPDEDGRIQHEVRVEDAQ